ncbi:ABC transporter permease [Acidicapsa acidisoli]|uniref:ABC transporter permease n=1 Tax=Acidicapsa acidisoli TaxID=1615681 RepID=UPI0021E07037|nr:ABC transporter permease [Acidicapsa acidisoli]
MGFASGFLRRLWVLIRRERFRSELDEEMAFHRAQAEKVFVASGMTPKAARIAAKRQFGNPERLKERSQEVVSFRFETVAQDLRFALRQLRKNPGFTATATLILALGIGASVAIFGFVDAALIKPLPYQEPSRLVGVYESISIGPQFHLSYLDYLDWKRLNKVFTSLEAYDSSDLFLGTPSGAERAAGVRVSDGFFRTLGVKPLLGRDFVAGEDAASAPRTVLLSYAAWQKRYGGAQDVAGQTVTLNGQTNTIIGVLPPEFHFAPVEPAEFWTTLHDSTSEDRGGHGLSGMARLKDGVSLGSAAADMADIAGQLARQYPDADGGRGATVLPLAEVLVGNLRPILLALLSGTALLLLIACMNVASLLLVRSESRRREIAVRGALGASPARLVRQFVTEGLVLTAGSTAAGVGLACLAIRLLARLIPPQMLAGMPYLRGLGLNFRVLAFAGMLALMACLVFSVAPAVRLYLSGRVMGMQAALAEGARGSAGIFWRRLGSNMVLVELAMAMVLLTGAGLLGKSLYRLLNTNIGMRSDHLAMLRVTAPGARYEKVEKKIALAKQVVERLRSLPGVRSAGICTQPPLNSGSNSVTFMVVGRPKNGPPDEVNIKQIDSGYFATVGAQLFQGRSFTENDDAARPPVMIINQAMARAYFPSEDPIGKRIIFDESTPPKQIVGIVQDIKEGPLDVATKPVMYDPYPQEPDNWFFAVVRTWRDERAMLPVLGAAIREIDPTLATFGETTMSARINDSSAAYLHRSSAWLACGFAAIALVLSVVGLYGVIAYSVSQRTREIGVRMALGAPRGSVYGMILGEAGWLTGIGIVLGLACSIGAATLMRKLLFGTAAWDAETLAGVTVVLAGAAMLASYLPARRAARVDPAEALRTE